MRMLHTADWHMNARLGREDRSQDIIHSLECIAEYLEEYQVDVMIVAGDLFCDRSDRETLKRAVGEIKRIFGPFLTRDKHPGTIVAISGNHDSDVFFETLRHALDLAPAPAMSGGLLALGRFYPYHRPSIVRIADQAGAIVQFLLMPYPKESWLRELEYDTTAGQNRMKQNRFTNYLQQELLDKKLNPALPAVLVSHILVEGATTRQGYRLGLEQDVVFSPGDMPTQLAYIAYGHVHQSQMAVTNAPWIRYCGSVERLDAGERGDDKSVVLLDISPEGLVAEPILLPLETTPIEKCEFGEDDDPEQAVTALEEKWQNHQDRERVLASIKLHYMPGVHAPDALRERLKRLFPRLYDCILQPVYLGADSRNNSESQIDLADVAKNAIDYVEKNVGRDPRKVDLLAALYELLTDDIPDETQPVITDAEKQEAMV